MVKPTAVDRYVIDLHCDTLTECLNRGIGLDSPDMPHFALGRLPQGLRYCQMMAVFMPDDYRGAAAEEYFRQVYDVYLRQMELHRDCITPVEDLSIIGQTLDSTRFAAVLTVEGGSVLAGKLENVETLFNKGVRMMTLTWNAANEIAGGAATEEGFTPFGRQVVAEMERVGMAVDVSHLSDRGFWELCQWAEKPFAASHSNSRTVCNHRRNLTDDMFREFVSRRGLVGLNYSDYFIREGGGSVSMEDLLRHIHHFLDLGGEGVLALGSDYDGTDIPPYLEGLDKIGGLIQALEQSGIPDPVINKILFENASRFFTSIKG